jgi:tetratricopeptide (TPR) repeat protein
MRIVWLSLAGLLYTAVALGQAPGPAPRQSPNTVRQPAGAEGNAQPGKTSRTPAVPEAEFERLKAQAEAARDTDQVREALGFYELLVKMRPDWAEGWWHLGALNYDLDNYEAGARAFSKFVVAEPDNGQGWGMLGLCEFRLNSYANALQHLTKARSLGLGGNDGLTRVVRYHQALLLNLGRQFEAAKGILTGFAVENRESPQVLDALGMSVLRISQPLEDLRPEERNMVREFGKAAFLEVSRRQPEAVNLYGELAARYKGKPNVAYACGAALAAQKQGTEAIAYFEEELRRDPSHVAAMLQLAFELSTASRFREALTHAQQASGLEPGNPIAYYLLGQIFFFQNEIEKALRMLEKARGLASESSQIRYLLSQAYQRAGRSADAQKERAEFQRLRQLERERQGQLATYMPGDRQEESEPPQ